MGREWRRVGGGDDKKHYCDVVFFTDFSASYHLERGE